MGLENSPPFQVLLFTKLLLNVFERGVQLLQLSLETQRGFPSVGTWTFKCQPRAVKDLRLFFNKGQWLLTAPISWFVIQRSFLESDN